MTIESMNLDPDAQAYADLAELDAAAASKLAGIADNAEVNPANTDGLTEGAINKYDTGVPPADLEALPDGATRKAMLDAEKTKLTGIEADAKDDQTGAEIRDAVVALPALDRKILVTEPVAGEHKVISTQRKADGTLDVKYESVPEA